MSRANSDYSFVTTSATEIETTVKDMYYTITGRNPTGVDLLFCQWVASAVMFLNENINAAANQNLASRAEGDNLDAIGEEIYLLSRPEAQAAGVQMQFTTSMELEAAYIIPAGTRVTTEDGSVIFTTDEDVVIEAGSDTASVHCTCTETGTEAYWSCSVCNKLFSDEDATAEIEAPVVIPAKGHMLTAHAEVDSTCTEAGTEAYWSCSVCDKLFSDEEATAEIDAPVVIAAKGHNWNTSTYVWADDNSSVTATHICKNCKNSSIRIERAFVITKGRLINNRCVVQA